MPYSTPAYKGYAVQNSYKQNFSSREFRGIFELRKLCITQNKKNFTSVF